MFEISPHKPHSLTDDAIYQHLDTSRSEIRLLEILTSEPGRPVECRLHTVSLDDNPTFEALSYVWGMRLIPKISPSMIIKSKSQQISS